LRARPNVYRYLRPTPLYFYQGLSDLIGAQVWVKHENHQPTGAFKVRGGFQLAASLSPEERRRGLATASTGNHGQSIAYAGQVYGIPVLIAMPEGANPDKAARIRAFGARLVYYGPDYDTAREWVMHEAATQGYRYVGPADPELIAGVATYSLEILEELPDVEVIIVPIGGGSGAAGACLVAKAIRPAIQVIGVQAEKAPAAYLAWKSGKPATAGMATFAEGLATRTTLPRAQGLRRWRPPYRSRSDWQGKKWCWLCRVAIWRCSNCGRSCRVSSCRVSVSSWAARRRSGCQDTPFHHTLGFRPRSCRRAPRPRLWRSPVPSPARPP